jgi:hypothetical protein
MQAWAFTFAEQLVLNLAGPLLSVIVVGLAAAELTRRAQNRRDARLREADRRREDENRAAERRSRDLDLKATLVDEMTEGTERYFSRLSLIELKGESAESSLDDAIADWRMAWASVSAKLGVYVPRSSTVHAEWGWIGAALWTLFFLFKNETPEAREQIVRQNSEYFGDDPGQVRALIERPLTNVGPALAQYDFELERLLDRYRGRREAVLLSLLRESPAS